MLKVIEPHFKILLYLLPGCRAASSMAAQLLQSVAALPDISDPFVTQTRNREAPRHPGQGAAPAIFPETKVAVDAPFRRPPRFPSCSRR
jgi:hypothetical protein